MSIEPCILLNKECTPCKGGIKPLTGPELQKYIDHLEQGWELVDDKKIEKQYKFKNFKQALDFTNTVGQIAEAEQHHPDIYLAWGKVKLMLWTHKIGGLHENDFILAAKADKAYSDQRG